MMAESLDVRLMCKPACRLGECPLWNAAEGRLYFTDAPAGRIWRCDPATGGLDVFWKGNKTVGGFAFNREGNLVVCARNEVGKVRLGGEWERLHILDFAKGERFNDITTDAAGRLYAGTLTVAGGMGRLLLFERGKEPRELVSGVNLSNGMGFSPDGRYFYHAVTKACAIMRYDYDVKTGDITEGRLFYDGSATREWPDGLTVDVEGCLWVAFWSGGVKRISPEGKTLATIAVPATHPTSVMFGGENMDELFITSSADGVFRARPGVKGRAEWPANL